MLWSTGEIGGASGVTMAERTREGGCRTSGGRFSIPLGNAEPLPAARLPQRFAASVRASTQSHFARDEPSDCTDWRFCRRAQDYVWRRTELQRSRGQLPRDNQDETRSYQDCRAIRKVLPPIRASRAGRANAHH